MNVIPHLIICLFVMAGSSGAFAQDAKEIPTPVPPLVAPVPEMAAWTVTVTYPPAPPPVAGDTVHHDWRFVEVQSTKTGKLKRDIITTREGLKRENWFVDTMLFWTTPKGDVSVNEVNGADYIDPENDNPSVAKGFPGVAWLSLKCFVDVPVMDKRPCFHYVSGVMEAWVDTETKLPLAYKRGPIVYKFKYNPPPTESLVMPPAYQAALDSVRAMKSRRK